MPTLIDSFDSLYISSNNKYISEVNVDIPVNVETPKKNLKITSLRALTNIDKSPPNFDVVTETPELEDNSAFKFTFKISKNVPNSSDSNILPVIPESNKSVHEVSLESQRSAIRYNYYIRNDVFDTFYEDYVLFF